jgi:hypothetical protein
MWKGVEDGRKRQKKNLELSKDGNKSTIKESHERHTYVPSSSSGLEHSSSSPTQTA